MHRAKRTKKWNRRGQRGMASTQVLCVIAIACPLMFAVVKLAQRGNWWMGSNWTDLHGQAQTSELESEGFLEGMKPLADLQEPGDSDAGSDRIPITSQQHIFAAATAVGPKNSGQANRSIPGIGNRSSAPRYFGGREHKLMGNLAATRAGTRRVRLAKDYDLSVGEMVAMADYFESPRQLWWMANQHGPGPGTREEVEYVRVVRIGGRKHFAGRFSPEVVAAVDKRHLELASNNGDHFSVPREQHAHLPPHRRPESAGHTYRSYHLRALGKAIAAGRHGESINAALREESFGAHYLTDAISAGHVRAPRQDVQEWWDARDPGLDKKFRAYLAARISEQVINNGRITRLVPGVVLDRAKRSVDQALAGKPKLTMGTLVALALHDYGNQQGLDVVVNQSPTRVTGDGFLDDPNISQRDKNATISLGANAVQAGIDDLRKAHQLAARHPNMSPREIVQRLKNQDGLFASEQFIPSTDSSRAQPLPNWKVQTVDDLIKEPQMMNAMEIVVLEKIKVLEELGKGLEGRARQAILDPNDGVVAQFKASPGQTLREILEYDGSLEVELRDTGLSDPPPF